MRTQAEALAQGREAQSTDDLEAVEAELEAGKGCAPATPAAPEKKYGFLAVCAGDGLAAVFQDLGADGVVSGGQTMNPPPRAFWRRGENPSRDSIHSANNGNIIMAAQQCDGLTEKHVVVIPTKTVPQASPP